MNTSIDKKRELAKRNPSRTLILDYMQEATKHEVELARINRILADAAHRLLRDRGMSDESATELTSNVAGHVADRFANLWAECLFEEIAKHT